MAFEKLNAAIVKVSGLPILRTWLRITRNLTAKNVTVVAGGVAFYAFLSIFPAIASVLMIWGLFTEVSDLNPAFSLLQGTVPAPVYDLISEQMLSIAGRDADISILAALASLLVAFWGASKAVNAILMAMRSMYNLQRKPSFIVQKSMSFIFTVLGIVFAVASIALVGVIPAVLEALRLGETTNLIILLVRWVLIVGFFFGGAVLFYKVSRRDPSRVKHANRNQVYPGAIAASLIWLMSSFGFSFYLSNFASYNETFGSLGAVAALLIWLWITALALLAGAEINTDFEGKKSRQRDAVIPH